jgi:hypothetical protein
MNGKQPEREQHIDPTGNGTTHDNDLYEGYDSYVRRRRIRNDFDRIDRLNRSIARERTMSTADNVVAEDNNEQCSKLSEDNQNEIDDCR